jgi:hypothetical protein
VGIESNLLQAIPFGTSDALNDQNIHREVLPHASQHAADELALTSSKCFGERTSTPGANIHLPLLAVANKGIIVTINKGSILFGDPLH